MIREEDLDILQRRKAKAKGIVSQQYNYNSLGILRKLSTEKETKPNTLLIYGEKSGKFTRLPVLFSDTNMTMQEISQQ